MSGQQNGIPVATKALWTWTPPVVGQAAQVTAFPTTGGPTKSGIMPQDVRNYILIPIVQFGSPPVSVPDSTIIGWIRQAEDDIETETGIRLCQTWIAAPAAKAGPEVQALNLSVQHGYQQPGIDFDYEEPGYDFFF